jgi:hypothetical protein
MWITLQVLVVAILVATILISVSAIVFNYYLLELFDVNIFIYILSNLPLFLTIVGGELVILFGISFLVSFSFVSSLNRKI